MSELDPSAQVEDLLAQVATLTAERDRTVGASVRAAALAARLAQAERVVEAARNWAKVWRMLVDIGQPVSAAGRDLLAAVDALAGTAGPGEEGGGDDR